MGGEDYLNAIKYYLPLAGAAAMEGEEEAQIARLAKLMANKLRGITYSSSHVCGFNDST